MRAVLVPLALALGSIPAHAAGLLTCEQAGQQSYACAVAPGLAPVFPTQPFEMDIDLKYAFQCDGNVPALAFVDGSTHATGIISFTNAAGKTLHLVGNGPVRLLDTDPDVTGLGVLIGGCDLKVLSTKAFPSNNTLATWQGEASHAKDAINDALDTWLLARNLEQILTFDDAEFQRIANSVKGTIAVMLAEADLDWGSVTDPATGRFKAAAAMPPAWDDVLTMHADLPNLAVVYDYALDITKARPPVHSPTVVQESADDLTAGLSARYLAVLKRKIKAGQRILDRGNAWLDVLQGEMAALKQRVADLRQTFPVLNQPT